MSQTPNRLRPHGAPLSFHLEQFGEVWNLISRGANLNLFLITSHDEFQLRGARRLSLFDCDKFIGRPDIFSQAPVLFKTRWEAGGHIAESARPSAVAGRDHRDKEARRPRWPWREREDRHRSQGPISNKQLAGVNNVYFGSKSVSDGLAEKGNSLLPAVSLTVQAADSHRQAGGVSASAPHWRAGCLRVSDVTFYLIEKESSAAIDYWSGSEWWWTDLKRTC